MKKLKQKFHGLPSLPIFGKQGETGENANSIYIGNINDFFDGVFINTDTFVKIAKVIDEDVIASAQKLAADRIKFAYNILVDPANPGIDPSAYYDGVKDVSIFYTGSFLNNDNIDKDSLKISNFDAIVEFDQNYISDIHLLLGNKSDAFTLLNNTKFEYIDITKVMRKNDKYRYDYDIDSLSPILMSNVYIASDPQDESKTNIVFSIEQNDSNSYNAAIGPDGFSSTLIYNIADTTSYGAMHILPYVDTTALLDFDKLQNNSAYQLYQKSAIKSLDADNTLFTNPLYDSNMAMFIGGNELAYNDYDNNDLKDTEIVNRFYIDNICTNKTISSYPSEDYMNSLQTFDTQSFNGHVYWTKDSGADQVFIPTTLKSDYKVGDTLYFYLSDSDFQKDQNILYMVVISENMIGCSQTQLMQFAQLTDPFKIKYLYNINNRATSYYNITSLRSSLDTSDNNVKQSLHSLVSIPSSDSNLLLINDKHNYLTLGAQYNKFSLDASNTENTQTFNFSSTKNSIDDNHKLTVESLSIDNLYINKNSNTNIELYDSLYDKNIKLTNGFIEPLKSIEVYNINNRLYLGKELYKSDYIDSEDSNYAFGYEIFDITNQMIQSAISSDEKIQMFIDVKNINVSDVVEEQLIVNQFISIGNVYNMNLDWSNKTYEYVGYIDYNGKLFAVYDSNIKGELNQNVKILVDLLGQSKKIYSFASFNNDKNKGYYCYNEEINDFNNSIKPTIFDYDSDGNYIIDETGKIQLYNIGQNQKIQIYPINTLYNAIVNVTIPNNIVMDKIHYASKNYIILFALNKNNGLKYYSKVIELNSIIDNDNVLIAYSINLLGDDVNIINENPNCIKFNIDNISSEENVNKQLFVDIDSCVDPSTITYYINGAKIIADSSEYSNGWMSISKEDNEFTINTSNNLPTNIDGNIYTDIDSYISTGSNDGNYECELFEYITNNGKLPESNQRAAKLQVTYKKKNEAELYVSDYLIEQPGFTDNRYIPEIKLNLNNDIISLSQINTQENDVKCNQIVSYLDIDISDIKNLWKSCCEDYSQLGISFDIENIDYDLLWKDEYVVDNGTPKRSTIKFVPTIDEELNNYISLTAECDSLILTIDSSVYAMTNTESNPLYNIESDNKIMLEDIKQIYTGQTNLTELKSVSNGIFKKFKFTVDIDSIQDLTENNIRVKLIFEIGNPIIANLYLRFAVTNLTVKYKGLEFNTGLAIYDNTTDVKTQLHEFNTKYTQKYRFISEPLDIMVNPMSYIICPEDQEYDITNISGNIYKVGSEKQIMKQLKFYNTDMYESDYITNIDPMQVRTQWLYDWKALKLKTEYFQDNVKNIVVKSLNKKLNINNDPIYTNAKIDYNYLDIIYYATIMQPRIRENGKYTFFYNANEYDRDKYFQYFDKPIFANESVMLEIRDQKLIDAMDKWNDIYSEASKHAADSTFTGLISSYSNGYMYLNNEYDYGQYNNLYNLSDTKKQNNEYIFNNHSVKDIEHIPFIETTQMTSNEPDANRYYRSFLYDINWAYPHLTSETSVELYQILSSYDYIKNSAEFDDKTVNYNELFDIYPRIMFNNDRKTINTLMLRCPTIGKDNDIDTSKYKLQKRYFDLIEVNTFSLNKSSVINI